MGRRNLNFINNKNYEKIARDKIKQVKLSEAYAPEHGFHYVITNNIIIKYK